MIKFDHVSISFNQQLIIDNLVFEVAKGQHVALTGPSGSGKSSLLKSLLGFVVPSSGTITLGGQVVSPGNISAIRKNIAWMPQEIAFPFENAKDAVLHVFQFQTNKKQMPDDSQVNHLMEAFQLGQKLLEKKWEELSGGQKQRFMLMATLLQDKPVLLLDEPFSALDNKNAEIIIGQLETNFSSKTIITSSHEQKWLKSADIELNLQLI